MKRWIPRSLRNDGMLGGDDIPAYATEVTPYILLADHEQSLAEKDQEIVYLQSERLSAAAMGDQRDRDYHAPMKQAVRFALYVEFVDDRESPSYKKAQEFLTSPEVRAWREQEGKS